MLKDEKSRLRRLISEFNQRGMLRTYSVLFLYGFYVTLLIRFIQFGYQSFLCFILPDSNYAVFCLVLKMCRELQPFQYFI